MKIQLKNLFSLERKSLDPVSVPQLNVPGAAGRPNLIYYQNDNNDHWYVQDGSFFSRKSFFDLNMSTVSGKAKALSVVTPLAAMVDRMGKLFANGADYVTDVDNNENFGVGIYDDVRSLLAKPNIFQVSSIFKRQVESYLIVYGFCPIFGLRTSKNDIPVSLWCIPPELFYAELTGKFLMQTDYREIVKKAYVNVGNDKLILDPEDYFIVFSGQVNMGYDGQMTVSTPVDTLSQTCSNWINQAIARGAVIKDGGPKGIITNDDKSDFGNASLTQKEQDRINREFLSKYGWVGKEFKVLVSQAALKWQAMSWNAKELMLDETRKATMEDICFTLGWPYGLFDPSSQYANNVAGEERRAYTSVIIPDSELYAKSLTEFLNQPGLKYYIDYSHVDSLQRDQKLEADTLNSIITALNLALSNAGITKEEYRIALSKYMDIDPDNIQTENKTMLAYEIGVGGTQSLVSVVTDPNMTGEQKRGVLKVLFNLDDQQVAEMIPDNG